jgi:Na+/proline symporter
VPQVVKPLVFLAFFGMFITTAESLLNWGASFLTIDAYKHYIKPKASEKSIRIISFSSMFVLSLLSMIFALQVESLQSVIKITFSIAAGVAPVYILRWIWYRINAWSQLSAMFSSAVFTLLYPKIHAFLPLAPFPVEEARVVVVTILTTVIWIAVTFLTENQQKEVEQRMHAIVDDKKLFIKRFIFALFLGACFLLIIAFSWWSILN